MRYCLIAFNNCFILVEIWEAYRAFRIFVQVSRNAIMIICTQMVKHSTVDKFRPYILTLCDLIHFLSRFIAKQFYETNYRQRKFWIKLISRSFTKIRLICAHLQRAKMDKLLSYRKKYKILIDYCDGMYYKDIHILFPYFLAHLLERNALR